MGRMRDQGNREVAHADASGRPEAEGDEAVREIELLGRAGHRVAAQPHELTEDAADLG